MKNKEKAVAIVKDLETQGFDSQYLAKMIEKTLNRLDAPEPKKWEPREGEYAILSDGSIVCLCGETTPNRHLTGRQYPAREEAERAAPLHRKMDRLVNWLIEHFPLVDASDAHIVKDYKLGNINMYFAGTNARTLKDKIDSGEVEL